MDRYVTMQECAWDIKRLTAYCMAATSRREVAEAVILLEGVAERLLNVAGGGPTSSYVLGPNRPAPIV
jgi:hypothetical protein